MLKSPGAENAGAIILAAGFSSRMGEFKPLLPLDNQSLVARLVNIYQQAGLENIIVVIGHNAPRMQTELAKLRIKSVINEKPEDGMFSSVVTGLLSLSLGLERVFIHPVDIPLIRPDTIQLLLEAKKEDVIIPEFYGAPGHPPLISSKIFSEIINYNGFGGLRACLASYKTIFVPVADKNINFDLDNMSDYVKAQAKIREAHILSGLEAKRLLCLYFKAQPKLVKHSQKVTQVALTLNKFLPERAFNKNLITAACLLHDIAKGQTKHARKGAAILTEMGFAEVAAIVAEHQDLKYRDAQQLSETEIVYLADKLVHEDQVTTLQSRFDAKRRLYRNSPEALEAINARHANTQALAVRVEKEAGRPLADILHGLK